MNRLYSLRLPAIALILLLAFALRFSYLLLQDYHIDEFFTLAAAQFVAQQGQPLYPTGLFYDPGLPYSYLGGGLFRLFGYAELLGRWPAVLFATLAVALTYALGRRVFHGSAAALLAALLLTLSLESVQWGGRARATSLAQALVLLSTLLLWLGWQRADTRLRLAAAFSYGLCLLAHFSTVVLLPGWFLGGLLLWRLKQFALTPALLRDSLLFGLGFGGVVGLGVVFQPPPSVEFQAEGGGLAAKLPVLLDKFLELPPDLASVGPSYFWYFAEWPHGPLTTLALLGIGLAAWRHWRGRSHPGDVGALFLGTVLLTVLFVLIFLIDTHWQRPRYLVMQVQGLFLLLGSYGLYSLWLELRRFGSSRLATAMALPAAALLLWPFVPPLQAAFETGYLGWNRYDLAAEHVAEHIDEGDVVATMHPPVPWLYLQQNDYYLVQSSPKLILTPDGAVGDRYTGAAWLADAAALNQVLDTESRLWLLVQEGWLFDSYDGRLQQTILSRMDKVWGEGGVWALQTRPGTWPPAETISHPVEAQFVNGTRLLGFHAEPDALAPGGNVRLTFFWHGETMPHNRKVFVQLRNAANETVAQADHFIYNGHVPSSRWEDLLSNDVALRDGATLLLPADLPPGQYGLWLGFYDPQSFARLGLVDDQSGENARLLRTWAVE